MIGPFLIVGIFALFVLVAALAWKAEMRRRAELTAFARSKGWLYTPKDVLGLANRWRVHPFGRGRGRRVSNLIRGAEGGRDFVSFDYQFTETDRDSDGKSSNRTYRFHVTAINLPCYFPSLEVGPENFLTRIGKALGGNDIDLESENFNRRFRVRCPDVKFAHDVLHPRTMEFLLGTRPMAMRIEGGDLLCWDDGRMKPTDVLRHLYVTNGVVSAIPSFVWKDHGYDPASIPNPPGGVAT